MLEKPIITSGTLLSQLTASQLKQLEKETSEKTALNKHLHDEERARVLSYKLYESFKQRFEVCLNDHSLGCVEDSFGNANIEIPIEKVESLKEALRSICESTISDLLGLMRPLDTAEAYSDIEDLLFQAKKEIEKKVPTLETIPHVAYDLAAKTGNSSILDEFQALYKRGMHETIEMVLRYVRALNEKIELRNELLTSLSELGKMKS